MFREIFVTQWKWTRTVVLIASVIAFALPLTALQAAHSAQNAETFVWQMERWGPSYSVLAAAVGLLVALAAWANDHRGRHVYALALPVSRARYVMMRLGAGAAFVIVPILALLMGSVLVAWFGGIPTGLNVYPVALTVRFALAALVAYAIFFAVSAATPKTAGVVLGAIAALLLVQYGLSVANVRYDVLSRVADFLFSSPGLLSVFAGRWMLIDV